MFRYLLLLLPVLIGCMKDDDPTLAVLRPKVGSTYTFSVAALDERGARVSNDSTKKDGERDSAEAPRWRPDDTVATLMVVASDVTFAGREDAVVFAQQGGGANDTTCVAYLENGDLAIAAPNPVDTRRWIWVTIPTSGRVTSDTSFHLDTIISEMPVHIDLLSSFGGSESMVVAGKPIKVQRGNMSFRVRYETSGGQMEGGIEEIIWFAPSIGFLVRKEVRGIGVDAFGAEQGMVMKLTGYTVK